MDYFLLNDSSIHFYLLTSQDYSFSERNLLSKFEVCAMAASTAEQDAQCDHLYCPPTFSHNVGLHFSHGCVVQGLP